MAHGKKTGGRSRGTPNKANKQLKERIQALIEERFESIAEDMNTLEPKERVTAYLKFMEYILPKQREQKIDLSALSDEQVDDILNRAMNKLD